MSMIIHVYIYIYIYIYILTHMYVSNPRIMAYLDLEMPSDATDPRVRGNDNNIIDNDIDSSNSSNSSNSLESGLCS